MRATVHIAIPHAAHRTMPTTTTRMMTTKTTKTPTWGGVHSGESRFSRLKRSQSARTRRIARDVRRDARSEDDDEKGEGERARDWRAFRAALIKGETQRLQARENTNGESAHWAHALKHIERGSVLLGPDGDVARATTSPWTRCVLLILSHENEGTTGVIVNRECTSSKARTLREYAPELDFSNPALASLANARAGFGGPVMHGLYPRSLVVLSSKAAEGVTMEVMPGVYVCDVEALAKKKSKLSNAPTLASSDLSVFLGYAGWTRNQLARELEDDFWTLVAADAALLRGAFFDSKDIDDNDNGDSGWFNIQRCLVDAETS